MDRKLRFRLEELMIDLDPISFSWTHRAERNFEQRDFRHESLNEILLFFFLVSLFGLGGEVCFCSVVLLARLVRVRVRVKRPHGAGQLCLFRLTSFPSCSFADAVDGLRGGIGPAQLVLIEPVGAEACVVDVEAREIDEQDAECVVCGCRVDFL